MKMSKYQLLKFLIERNWKSFRRCHNFFKNLNSFPLSENLDIRKKLLKFDLDVDLLDSLLTSHNIHIS